MSTSLEIQKEINFIRARLQAAEEELVKILELRRHLREQLLSEVTRYQDAKIQEAEQGEAVQVAG